MSCKIVGKDCRSSDAEKLPVRIDLTEFCERVWDNDVAAGIYLAGDFVRPTKLRRTGFHYECTIGGQVGVEEPEWPTAVNDTVQDGSVTWTCRAIGNQSLFKTINSALWDGDGYTVTDEGIVSTLGRQQVFCFISGTQELGKYFVTATVTFSDTHAEDFAVEVKQT